MPSPGPLLLALAITLALATPAAADPAADPADRAERRAGLSLTGNGYGHGRGLSQHGAQSRAQAGHSHTRILDFYYPGLEPGRAGGRVSVLVSADTTPDVTVVARRGLVVKQVGGVKLKVARARPGATRFRLLPVSRGRTRVQWFRSSWRTLRTLRGPAEFSAANKPVSLVVTSRQQVAYRGSLRAVGGDTVNVVRLEDYLRGVVPREVPALWHPEAVRAQAVAARTYAAFERRTPLARHYQICDTSSCQVYGGASAEHPATDAAIAATAKQIRVAGGEPAFTQFSASNGGWSLAGSQPYLPAQQDSFDTAYRGWTDTVTPGEVEQAYPALGTFTGARVTARDGHGQWGGRVTSIRLTGSRTSTTIPGDTFRSVFGLRSTYFTL